MKKKIILSAVTSITINCIIGAIAGYALGINPTACAIAANVIGIALAFVPKETGIAQEGTVYTEVWVGEIVKALNAGLKASWLDGIPDNSSLVNNNIINLAIAGINPDVLINNTTYPIPIQSIPDTAGEIALDKFDTKVTAISDDELYAISYDRMGRVKQAHADAITQAKYTKAAHAMAPDKDSAKTPVVMTTGEFEGGGTTGRKRVTRADIIKLKQKFDEMGADEGVRRLVLCNDHVNDLLLYDQKFADQYYNYMTGKIANLYGFQVYEFVNCPYFTTAGVKKDLGTAVAAGEYKASFAFIEPRIFQASGSTKMYFHDAATDPQNHQNLINFEHRFICLPKVNEAIGAIVSSYVAG
jgi:hypothetical protein